MEMDVGMTVLLLFPLAGVLLPVMPCGVEAGLSPLSLLLPPLLSTALAQQPYSSSRPRGWLPPVSR